MHHFVQRGPRERSESAILRRNQRNGVLLIARNGLRSCYIRPIVFRGYGQMGLYPLDAPVDVSIAVWEWGTYLGEEGKRRGVRAKVSSWRRIGPDSLIPHAKASGQYLNSVLAKVESFRSSWWRTTLRELCCAEKRFCHINWGKTLP